MGHCPSEEAAVGEDMTNARLDLVEADTLGLGLCDKRHYRLCHLTRFPNRVQLDRPGARRQKSPDLLPLLDGEEQELGAADEVVHGDGADLAEHTAVGGIVAIVAHDEDMPGGHLIDRRVVVEAVLVEVEGVVGDTVGQGLAIAPRPDLAAVLGVDEVIDPDARDGRTVDVHLAGDHLDAVARQTDHALDVVDVGLARQPEHHHVAAGRYRAHDAPVEEIGRERERVAGIAVGKLRDEEIVADEQRLLHRAGGNVERLEQECADHEGDEKRVDHHADRLAQSALVVIGHARRTSCRLSQPYSPRHRDHATRSPINCSW